MKKIYFSIMILFLIMSNALLYSATASVYMEKYACDDGTWGWRVYEDFDKNGTYDWVTERDCYGILSSKRLDSNKKNIISSNFPPYTNNQMNNEKILFLDLSNKNNTIIEILSFDSLNTNNNYYKVTLYDTLCTYELLYNVQPIINNKLSIPTNKLSNKNLTFISDIFPNPTYEALNIKIKSTKSNSLKLEIYNYNGSIACLPKIFYISEGDNLISYKLNYLLDDGFYILILKIDDDIFKSTFLLSKTLKEK